MKKLLIITFLDVIAICSCMAQEKHFINSGIIEYEKKSNMYAILSKQIDKHNNLANAFDNYKKSNPQFKSLKSTLNFSNSQTLFTPTAAEEKQNGLFDTEIANQYSIIYNNFNTNLAIMQKGVFEHTFLLRDSIRKIRWKITDETKNIAGYTCRRANAIIMDSIYVVAFYTNRILVPGGPESFTGLPGMILGIALPHENISWFATKIIETSKFENAVAPPKQGTLIDNKMFKETLNKIFNGWRNGKQFYLKTFEL